MTVLVLFQTFNQNSTILYLLLFMLFYRRHRCIVLYTEQKQEANMPARVSAFVAKRLTDSRTIDLCSSTDKALLDLFTTIWVAWYWCVRWVQYVERKRSACARRQEGAFGSLLLMPSIPNSHSTRFHLMLSRGSVGTRVPPDRTAFSFTSTICRDQMIWLHQCSLMGSVQTRAPLAAETDSTSNRNIESSAHLWVLFSTVRYTVADFPSPVLYCTVYTILYSTMVT